MLLGSGEGRIVFSLALSSVVGGIGRACMPQEGGGNARIPGPPSPKVLMHQMVLLMPHGGHGVPELSWAMRTTAVLLVVLT